MKKLNLKFSHNLSHFTTVSHMLCNHENDENQF